MSDTKTFPVGVVLSVLTGRGLDARLEQVHECMTHVLGWDIFTHEMGDRAHWARAGALILAQHPELKDAEAENFDGWGDGKSGEAACAAYLNTWCERVGKTLTLTRGSDNRLESPIATAQRAFGRKRTVVAQT